MLGLDFEDDGRSFVPFDMDGDGDLDIAMLSLQRLRMLENRSPARHFLRLRLSAREGPEPALGAVVEVETAGRIQRRAVALTEGFQSQRGLDLHFGLGQAETLEAVHVRWPSGKRQSWHALPIDSRIRLVEGEEGAEIGALPAWPAESRPPEARAAAPGLTARALGAAPKKEAEEAAREALALAAKGRPSVINFWAPWCVPCREELPQLAALAHALGEKVQFAGVSVEREDLDAVREAVEKYALEYGQFVADDELLTNFFGAQGAAALPSTFVFDADGALRRVFRRPVAGAELAALLESLDDEGDLARDLLRRGQRLLDEERFPEALDYLYRALKSDPTLADAHNGLGKLFAVGGDPKKAESFFTRATELDPDLVQAHYNLAIARLDQGRPRDAVAPIQAALRVRSDDLDILMTLGTVGAKIPDFELALDAFERATRLAPRFPLAWSFKARALMDLGRKDEALEAVSRALAIDPNFPAARELLKELGQEGR